jgi:hypothetical protein
MLTGISAQRRAMVYLRPLKAYTEYHDGTIMADKVFITAKTRFVLEPSVAPITFKIKVSLRTKPSTLDQSCHGTETFFL